MLILANLLSIGMFWDSFRSLQDLDWIADIDFASVRSVDVDCFGSGAMLKEKRI